ncbi:protein phosphatase 2C domain-containing protein [Thermomonas paludicola]|uniref:protein phosphatase 2C domain-containing protein n=1 Tax=Thermomonas paludicola TaxID=2884874 RepID=UPI00211580BD|nr:protein phosphatase 2C domain-containing protein [Thermomonas paludicola]
MARFQSPQDKRIEIALARLIRCQLTLHDLEADVGALVRIRQQLPVARFLDEIVEAGRRNAGQNLLMVDVSTRPSAEAPCSADISRAAEPGVPVSDATIGSLVTNIAETIGSPPDGEVGGEAVMKDAAPAAPTPKDAGQPMYRLLVPNATADVAYSYQLDLSREPLAAYRIHAISGLEEIGLTFDPETHRLHGTPCVEPGQALQKELEVVLARRDNPAVRVASRLSLFINPHPRTLWKKIEPDALLEHRKEHRCSLCEAGPPMVLAASVRGRSHENSGAFREDDFHVGRTADGSWTVVAVSDGAGSAKLSRLGSRIATETAVASLLDALGNCRAELDAAVAEVVQDEDALARVARLEKSGEAMLLEPVGRAAFAASKAIQTKAGELGVEEKALAATLMFAAIRRIGDDMLVASYWIGDGAAALFDPASGAFHLLGEADSGEFSGQTRFLLSQEFPVDSAWVAIGKRFRFRCVPVSAVLLLMTDGVSDPKFGTDNALRDPARWRAFWEDDLAAQLPLSTPEAELGAKLEDYLQFWSQGEHDDRTLALVRWA